MNKEDYFKYYVQGSDHYLLPKDIFDELFDEIVNWKNESQQLKEQVEYLRRSCERKEDTIISLENESIIDELEKWLVEKYFLWVPEIARGSKMMEVLKKINELKGGKND